MFVQVMSLVLLSEISALESGGMTGWDYAAPIVGCVGSVVVGIIVVEVTNGRLAALERKLPDR